MMLTDMYIKCRYYGPPPVVHQQQAFGIKVKVFPPLVHSPKIFDQVFGSPVANTPSPGASLLIELVVAEPGNCVLPLASLQYAVHKLKLKASTSTVYTVLYQ